MPEHCLGDKAFVKPFGNAAVAQAFEAYPPEMRRKLLALRELIFRTAAFDRGCG